MQLPYSNLQVKHQNPEASSPLILPIHVICNTDDAVIHENIRVNSRKYGDWLRSTPEHSGVAILCGSGPSLKDSLGDIKEKKLAGGVVFAMNGAAKFLADNGLIPDYQVIIDAREETAQLVGPAKNHLFASQCHPTTFAKAENPQLWHLQITNIEDLFDKDETGERVYKRSYIQIGGAASVGNTATCLAYAMGFRNLQIYGYDSSHREDESHAFSQPMNFGEPLAYVKFNGKEYKTSLTMKLQAEKFQETSRALVALGCKIEVHGDGLLPDIWNTPVEKLSEKEKYERMWAIPGYRQTAPGEDCVNDFLEVAKPIGTVIDFGCGTGRGGLKMRDAGLLVLLTDFTNNSRDQAAHELSFLQWDITEPFPVNADYGYCTDVMEHIHPDDVDKVIVNILNSTPKAFFQISTVPDNFGAAINQILHLTVEPHDQWRWRFHRLGYKIEWEKQDPISSMFYVCRT